MSPEGIARQARFLIVNVHGIQDARWIFRATPLLTGSSMQKVGLF
jgi:hypothetical protein